MRAFIAMPLPKRKRQVLYGFTERLDLADASAIAVDDLHITLEFFDNLQLKNVKAVIRCIDGVADNVHPFDIRISGLSTFRNTMPQVLFAQITRGSDICTTLHNNILHALVRAGVLNDVKKNYVPHITLARIKRADSRTLANLEWFSKKDFGSCTIDRISLFDSVMTEGRYVHTELHAVHLK